MLPEHLGDLPAHREHRVERGERVLEDHRDLRAPDLAAPLLRDLQHVLAAKRISPPVTKPGGVSRMPMMACAVTDFPEPDSPSTARVSPSRRREVDPVDGLGHAIPGAELDAQFVDLQQHSVLGLPGAAEVIVSTCDAAWSSLVSSSAHLGIERIPDASHPA